MPSSSAERRSGAGMRKAHVQPVGGMTPTVREVLRKVTRNCILNAVVKNKQDLQRENERLGRVKKKKTRAEIIAAMDLQELQLERIAMSRMGFLDKVEEIDAAIERERERLRESREEKEKQILDQKLAGLEMSQRRRIVGLEGRLVAEETALRRRCEKEAEELHAKHKSAYDQLIEETATRATGGVSSCTCTSEHLCRHNKSASYNTRKPTKDVIRLRQNAERLRTTGRMEEAEEFERQASAMEQAAEERWRKKIEQSIVSSAWAGGKSRLEQMIEKQQKAMASLEETHTEKMALLKKQHDIHRRNLRSTLEAERKKVIVYCRRAALKRMTRDIKEDAEERDRVMKGHSDGLQNISKNIAADSDDSDEDEDEVDDELDGDGYGGGSGGNANRRRDPRVDWSAPQMAGLDNSKAIVGYDNLKSGEVYVDLAEGRVDENGIELITTGSRFMDTWRMQQAGAQAVYDPTKADTTGAGEGGVGGIGGNGVFGGGGGMGGGVRLGRDADGNIVNREDAAAVSTPNAIGLRSAFHLLTEQYGVGHGQPVLPAAATAAAAAAAGSAVGPAAAFGTWTPARAPTGPVGPSAGPAARWQAPGAAAVPGQPQQGAAMGVPPAGGSWGSPTGPSGDWERMASVDDRSGQRTASVDDRYRQESAPQGAEWGLSAPNLLQQQGDGGAVVVPKYLTKMVSGKLVTIEATPDERGSRSNSVASPNPYGDGSGQQAFDPQQRSSANDKDRGRQGSGPQGHVWALAAPNLLQQQGGGAVAAREMITKMVNGKLVMIEAPPDERASRSNSVASPTPSGDDRSRQGSAPQGPAWGLAAPNLLQQQGGGGAVAVPKMITKMVNGKLVTIEAPPENRSRNGGVASPNPHGDDRGRQGSGPQPRGSANDDDRGRQGSAPQGPAWGLAAPNLLQQQGSGAVAAPKMITKMVKGKLVTIEGPADDRSRANTAGSASWEDPCRKGPSPQPGGSANDENRGRLASASQGPTWGLAAPNLLQQRVGGGGSGMDRDRQGSAPQGAAWGLAAPNLLHQASGGAGGGGGGSAVITKMVNGKLVKIQAPTPSPPQQPPPPQQRPQPPGRPGAAGNRQAASDDDEDGEEEGGDDEEGDY